MAVPLIINGTTFNYPQQGDVNWGPTLTNWSTAVTNALQVTSNNFTLLTNHSIVFKDSEGTPKSLTLSIPSPLTATWSLTLPVNAGSNGQVLSTNGSGVTAWINAAGGGTVNSGTTGQLAYYPGVGTTLSGETMSGDATIAAGGVLTIANLAITDAKIAVAAAIALSKLASTTAYYWYAANSSGVLTPLAVTASRIVITDANGLPTTISSPNLTEIAYVGGVTSAIQTQINTKLAKSGDTMSGVLNMGSNKIISVTQGANAGEAATFDQLKYFQTVQNRSATQTITTSSSFQAATNQTVTITPSVSSHRIKITASGPCNVGSASTMRVTLYRGVTELSTASGFFSHTGNTTNTGYSFSLIDSPATTSATTYQIYFCNDDNATSVAVGRTDVVSVLLAEEII